MITRHNGATNKKNRTTVSAIYRRTQQQKRIKRKHTQKKNQDARECKKRKRK